MVAKRFQLGAEQIQPLAQGHGACFATDMITVEGRRIAFMYREAPDNESDSGWRFMSGYESDAYMNDSGNLGIYDVNTIANYDPDIIPFYGRSARVCVRAPKRLGTVRTR